MNKNEEIRLLIDLMYSKYKRTILNASEAAAEVGRSESALKKDRQNATGIPYTRLNDMPHGQPLYSITAIAKTIINNEVKTF